MYMGAWNANHSYDFLSGSPITCAQQHNKAYHRLYNDSPCKHTGKPSITEIIVSDQ